MDRALARRLLVKRIYDKMSPDEKRLFVMLSGQGRGSDDVLQAVRQNQEHLQYLVEHAARDQWYTAFGSDVAANVLTTSVFWLLGRLFARR